jgi:flagellar hook-associated protein 3 FlgL
MYRIAIQSMNNQKTALAKLQEQTDGRRIHTPSDDPVASAQIGALNQWLNTTKQLDANRLTAEGVIAYEESILGKSVKALQDLRALQVKAGDPVLSLSDRQSMAVQAQNILLELQGLANTQDSNGNYIFSGSETNKEAITLNLSGQYSYNGDETQRYLPIASSITVALNDTAKALFMQLPNGNGDFTVTATASNTGSGVLTTGSVINRASYVADNYTLKFALNTNNQLVVMVSGTASGNVLPTTGNPDDAPLYQVGASIQFNGMEIIATGQPNAGDSFALNPKQNESIFSTGLRIINNLNSAVHASSDRALVSTENNQLLAQLDTALNTLLNAQAQAGLRLNQVSAAEKINADLTLTGETTIGNLRDANLEEVISDFSLQTLYLEIAMKTFTRVQGLSIFNYVS